MLTHVLAFLLLLPGGMTEEQARKRAQELYRAGQLFMQTELFEQAAGEFTKAIELDPLLMMAHYNLGQSYMALRRYDEAARAYQGARDSVMRIGHISEKERSARERAAKDEIQELRSSISAIRGGQIKITQPDAMITRLEERIRVLEGLEMRGRDEIVKVPPEIDLALGSAYFRQQKLAEAEHAYTSAVKADKKLGAAHNNLAVIYMLTGRYKDAHAAIASAESSGFKVTEQLKVDLQKREAAGQ